MPSIKEEYRLLTQCARGRQEYKIKTMGITAYDIKLIEKALEVKPDIKTVCELGSQNLYIDNDPRPPFASTWYKARGIRYLCIDMAGDNNALCIDLSKKQNKDAMFGQFDLVTDFGTSEHVVAGVEMKNYFFENVNINSVYPTRVPTEQEISEGFYNCWINKHNLLAVGGIMINVNPKAGNWPGHGYTYLTSDFYRKLAELMGYEIILLDLHAATGNTESGWNVVCILKKVNDDPFISFEDFQQCEQLRK
jgi:hypothetical protein